jgi:hypothetical protein
LDEAGSNANANANSIANAKSRARKHSGSSSGAEGHDATKRSHSRFSRAASEDVVRPDVSQYSEDELEAFFMHKVGGKVRVWSPADTLIYFGRVCVCP